MTFADGINLFFSSLAAVYIRFLSLFFYFLAEPSLLSCLFHILPTKNLKT